MNDSANRSARSRTGRDSRSRSFDDTTTGYSRNRNSAYGSRDYGNTGYRDTAYGDTGYRSGQYGYGSGYSYGRGDDWNTRSRRSDDDRFSSQSRPMYDDRGSRYSYDPTFGTQYNQRGSYDQYGYYGQGRPNNYAQRGTNYYGQEGTNYYGQRGNNYYGPGSEDHRRRGTGLYGPSGSNRYSTDGWSDRGSNPNFRFDRDYGRSGRSNYNQRYGYNRNDPNYGYGSPYGNSGNYGYNDPYSLPQRSAVPYNERDYSDD